jgi:hypothetical protein
MILTRTRKNELKVSEVFDCILDKEQFKLYVSLFLPILDHPPVSFGDIGLDAPPPPPCDVTIFIIQKT